MRQIVIISAMLLSIGLFTGIALPGSTPHCKPTNDLTVKGGITHFNKKGEAELSGYIVNSSKSQEYENVLIAATFYDADSAQVGYMEFSVKDDVEASEQENFRLKLHNADKVASVSYTVKCAEYN